MRLKKKAILFFTLVAIAIIAGSSAIYVYFFLPKTLSNEETAQRLNSLFTRTVRILNYTGNDIKDWVNHLITNTTFSNRMSDLKSDLLDVKTDLTELRKVAFPTYIKSIDYLDDGLLSCRYALDYAQDLNFNQTLVYLEEATEYIIKSTRAMPTS